MALGVDRRGVQTRLVCGPARVWREARVDLDLVELGGDDGEVLLFGGDEHWDAQQEPGGDFRKTRVYDVRTHALVGVTAVAAALVISGVTVTQEEGLRPRLTKEKVVAAPSPVSTAPAEEPVELSPGQLLTARQLSRVAPQRRWAETDW